MVDLSLSEGLRTALRNGAEIGIARAISRGADEQSIQHFVSARLSTLDASDISYIRGLANAILEAADYLSGLAPDEEPDVSQIPTNGGVEPGDWEGGRERWFGRWRVPGQDQWYDITGTLPDIATFVEQLEQARELASGYIDQYPGRFEGTGEGWTGEIEFNLIGSEKAF